MKKFELVETILSEQVDHKSNLRFDSILGIFQDKKSSTLNYVSLEDPEERFFANHDPSG